MGASRREAALSRLLSHIEESIPTAHIGGEAAERVLQLPAPPGYAVWVVARDGEYGAFISRRSRPQRMWHLPVGGWDDDPAVVWPRISKWLNAHQELNEAWAGSRQTGSPAHDAVRVESVSHAQLPLPRPSSGEAARPPTPIRVLKIRLVGFALVIAGLLFSFIPAGGPGYGLWTATEGSYGEPKRWTPFSGGAIVYNTGPFIAFVVFVLAGLVCLAWAALDNRSSR